MQNRFGSLAYTRKLLLAMTLTVLPAVGANAQSPTLEQLLSGVVHIKTYINADGRTPKISGASVKEPGSSSTMTGWC